MKKQLFFAIFFLMSSLSFAQKIEFTLSVNKDTVLMNNLILVKYTAKQVDLDDFETPNFLNFQVVSGPNVSTSISYVNGEKSQESSYSFYLKPDRPGIWTIPAVSINTEQGVVATKAKDIVVLPNPEGIQEESAPERNSLFDQFYNRSPFPPPVPQVKPAKKKRKTYRL